MSGAHAGTGHGLGRRGDVVRLSGDHRPERMDGESGPQLGLAEHEARDDHALARDGRLERQTIVGEPGAIRDGKVVEASQPGPTVPAWPP